MAIIYQLRNGVIDHKTAQSLYSKTFDKIRKVTEAVKPELSEFFSQEDSNLETTKIGEVFSTLDTPPRNEQTARIPLLTPLEGYNVTVTAYEYRSGFIITEKAVLAQKTRMITQMLTGLPNSAKRLEELAYADMLNKAFATNTGGDGQYVLDTDHTYEDAQFGTWSNTAASGATFSTSTYFAAWLNLQNRKDEKGFPKPMLPDAVVFPPALMDAVSQVHGSQKYPENALNAEMDTLYRSFRMVPCHWLSSAASWYVHAKVSEAEKGLIMVWQIRPKYSALSDPMNPQLIMGKSLDMSFGTGALQARDWYGNVGS